MKRNTKSSNLDEWNKFSAMRVLNQNFEKLKMFPIPFQFYAYVGVSFISKEKQNINIFAQIILTNVKQVCEEKQ